MPDDTASQPLATPRCQDTLAERLVGILHRAIRELKVTSEEDWKQLEDDTDPLCPVTLVCVSDTGPLEPRHLPCGDILFHAGNLSTYGSFEEIQATLTWINQQPHEHKVVIGGNHDLLLDSFFVDENPGRGLDEPGRRRVNLNWGSIHYLAHDCIDLALPKRNRSVRIFGSPWTPEYGYSAFQYASGSKWGAEVWNTSVSDKTDVMLVHGPPMGHLDDGGKGCRGLLGELWRVKPKVLVCGHIRAGRGRELLIYDRAQELYDGVVLGKNHIWMSAVRLAFLFFWLVAKSLLGRGPSPVITGQTKRTRIVNASILGPRSDFGPRNGPRNAMTVII
ncbi:hypothetical protein G7Z17_g2490 [Cylindrodendrum hubeiense]|uniref:Calcineurin-like phosphoesterase domain-containing protein n=1 Tax=Cylindrodendrum hubeiense TaxID=595255 RepID=A0A9P5HJL9_9HYPO|nr:hypothetical protein G7Z17_g2490 [Cylindrodendrum hubeiense]